jgi:hypothetical protein
MKARPSFEKRRKEMARQERKRDKAERRKTRRDEKADRPDTEGEEDPDLIGIKFGPQPVEDEDEDEGGAPRGLPRADAAEPN